MEIIIYCLAVIGGLTTACFLFLALFLLTAPRHEQPVTAPSDETRAEREVREIIEAGLK